MEHPSILPELRTTVHDRLEREAERLRQLAGARVRLVIDFAPQVSGIRVQMRGYTIVILCDAQYPTTTPAILAAPTGETLVPVAIVWERYLNLRELVMDLVIDLMLDAPLPLSAR